MARWTSRRAVAAISTLVVTAGVAVRVPAAHASGSAREDRRGCEARGPAPTAMSVDVAGETRSALVHVPTTLNRHKRAPVVLTFHGFGSTAELQAGFDGMNATADANGFISVHPQGRFATVYPDIAGVGWDIFNPMSPDPGFVGALLDQLSAKVCVDSKRVYATGLSNGGGEARLLSCKLADRIAAISAIAGDTAPLCPGGPSMPSLSFHGVEDMINPYYLGSPIFLQLPIETAVASEALRNGCEGEPRVRAQSARVELLRWRDCDVPTLLYRLHEHGHSWPGRSYGVTREDLLAFGFPPEIADNLLLRNDDIDATELSWQFFRRFSLDD